MRFVTLIFWRGADGVAHCDHDPLTPDDVKLITEGLLPIARSVRELADLAEADEGRLQ